MTRNKDDCKLPTRTPQFLSRETCAAEFEVSVSTWDDWVKSGVVPKPYMLGRTGSTPRWSWDEISEHIRTGGKAQVSGGERNPFFDPNGFKRKDGETRKAENYRR